MPADEFWYMSDADFSKIIQALRATPPVDRDAQPNEFTVLMKGLGVFGVFPLLPAAAITSEAARSASGRGCVCRVRQVHRCGVFRVSRHHVRGRADSRRAGVDAGTREPHA